MMKKKFNYFAVDEKTTENARKCCEDNNYKLLVITKMSKHPDDDFLNVVLAHNPRAMDGYQYAVWTYNGRGLDVGSYSQTFKQAVDNLNERIRKDVYKHKETFVFKRQLRKGDSIIYNGRKVTIEKILSDDYNEYHNNSSEVKFIDSNGECINWKPEIDGGYIDYHRSYLDIHNILLENDIPIIKAEMADMVSNLIMSVNNYSIEQLEQFADTLVDFYYNNDDMSISDVSAIGYDLINNNLDLNKYLDKSVDAVYRDNFLNAYFDRLEYTVLEDFGFHEDDEDCELEM